jgi:hypothetical protein
MKHFFLILLLSITTAGVYCSPPEAARRVEVVFCLDMSASTNGLIDRFRDHLWDYTYFFSTCSPVPEYRIGVVGFSRPTFKRENGYVKVLKDLTTDMESLSKEMFDLKSSIEKGDQFVGHALIACAKDISWSKDSSVIKVLFVVGNGLVTLGGTDFRNAAAELQSMGVVVNTLYCSNRTFNKRELGGWADIAEIGKGKFTTFSVASHYYGDPGVNINQLRALNDSLNKTYLYYGPNGKEHWEIMTEQDRKIYNANAEGYLYRCLFKISPLYQKKNTTWDLIDLVTVNGSLGHTAINAAYLRKSLQSSAPMTCRKL